MRAARSGAALLSVLVLSGCVTETLLPGEDSRDQDADDDRVATGRSRQEIVAGDVTTDLPSAGMLLIGGRPEVAISACGVTLVGCNKALTSAHCVCERFGAACAGSAPRFPTYAYFQHAGFFRVQTIEVHPDFNENAEHDLAVLTFSRPVRGIRPARLATRPVPPGSQAVIAGFGRAGGDEVEFGIKRRGLVTTSACLPQLGQGKLCWRFDGSEDSSDSNVCHGDSGGATFVERDGTFEIAGIHSTTSLPSCLEDPELQSADTSVYDHRSFLVDRVIDPPLLACGDLPHIGDPGAVSMTESGSLDLGEHIDVPVEVPPGTAELRVAMNSSDGVGANFDLYLMAGAIAGPGRFDCKADGTSPHGFCQVASPAPGTWHVDVVADSGITGQAGGRFQLVTTALASAPTGHDDGYAVVQDQRLVVDANGVLENDVATERSPLLAVLERVPTHGTVELEADGSFVYTPRAGYVGSDSFRYRASDRTYSGVATVRLEVVEGEPERVPDDGGCAAANGSPAGGAAATLTLLLLALAIRSALPWRR